MSALRDTSHFSWAMVPLFVIVVFLFFRQAELGNWSRILAALALWGMDWFNEIWNALVYHFTQFAPVWGIGHDSSWLILAGLNIEIVLMFAVLGLACTLLLPADRNLKILSIDNRLFFACLNSLLCVGVELALNRFGMLVWKWPWWNATHPWLIFLIGYLPFFLVAYAVYDMPNRRRQIATVASILGFDAIALTAFLALGWV
ncbi:MAG: hypothetical protein JO199_02010 [Candidatus Eremiobacteraeota bacterium]|nr:hypothetical protein [Candidatus Eremiobacteraeota bacterium]